MVYSNPGDKIVLLNNVDLDFIYPIPINHPLTIDGNGFTLDIKHDAPAFYVNSPSVTLKNIRFENGNPALMWGNFSGTIKNCIFKSNCDGNDNVIRFLGCDCAFNERDLKAIGLNFKTQNILTNTGLMNIYYHKNSQERKKREIYPKNHFPKTISTMIMK